MSDYWNEATMHQDLLERLVRNACLAADGVAIGHPGTPAEKTRDSITRAIEMLHGNGLIQVTPLPEWPEFLQIDPPYDQRCPWESQ